MRGLAWIGGMGMCALGACAGSSAPVLEDAPDGTAFVDGGSASGPAANAGGTTGASPGTGGAPGADASTIGCNRMDILFVIDNSASMSEEQANLAENFPRFIEVLDTFRGGALDYRLGVTTTALGDLEFLENILPTAEKGALLRTPEMADPWLERGAPGLTGTFSQLATVGTTGSFTEQPLKAAKYALVDRVADGTNAGFRRDDALLALVILTDEDDGSTQEGETSGLTGTSFDMFIPGGGAGTAPVSDFIDAFDELVKGRDRWAATVIAGDQMPTCESQFGDASYAARLLEFVDVAGANATFGSICSGDLSLELKTALDTFSVACQEFVPLI